MVGSPLLVVVGVRAAIVGLGVGPHLVEDEPAVEAVPDGEVVGSVFPGVPPEFPTLSENRYEQNITYKLTVNKLMLKGNEYYRIIEASNFFD